MNPYQPIIKQTAKDVLGNIGLYSNTSKRYWYDDNGFFLTFLEIAPCNLGGVFLNMGIYPLWQKHPCFTWYPIDSYSGRITAPDVPNFHEALLYWEIFWNADFQHNDVNFDKALSFEEFELYLRKLLTAAKRKFEVDYKRYTDLDVFCYQLEHRKDTRCRRRDGHVIDLDHAIGEMTAGNVEKAKALMENAVAFSVRPQEVSTAQELLAHTNSREEWLAFLNDRIAHNRNTLASKFRFLTKKEFRFE